MCVSPYAVVNMSPGHPPKLPSPRGQEALFCRGLPQEDRSAGIFSLPDLPSALWAGRSRTYRRLLSNSSSVFPGPGMLLVVSLGPACSTHFPFISSPMHHHTWFSPATPTHLFSLGSPLLMNGRRMRGAFLVVHRVPAMLPSPL